MGVTVQSKNTFTAHKLWFSADALTVRASLVLLVRRVGSVALAVLSKTCFMSIVIRFVWLSVVGLTIGGFHTSPVACPRNSQDIERLAVGAGCPHK